MQVCTSLQTDNHANTSLLSFLQAGCPSCRPTNSVKALKAINVYVTGHLIQTLHTNMYLTSALPRLQDWLVNIHFLVLLYAKIQ